MLPKQKKSTIFYCFSPPVMIASFLIEAILAIFVLFKYQMNNLGRLIVITLSMLGLFQISEYFVCGGLGADSATWSRIGFVAITALPALGMHIFFVLTSNKSRKLVTATYATMAGFMAYFLIAPTAFAGHECTGNYVIFQIGTTPARLYGLYYYGVLLTSMLLGYRWIIKNQKNSKFKQSVTALFIGYLVFLIPTGIANTIKPETRAGIPSIMCGFAVIFALILALYIAPRMLKVREKFVIPFISK
jgi:hypothetical protein